MASRRRSPRLYPDLANELNEQQDETVDVTEDSSFEGEEVSYDEDRYQRDANIRPRRGAGRPRASASPSSSSHSTSIRMAARLLDNVIEQLREPADGNWQEYIANNLRGLAVAAFLVILIPFLFFAGPMDGSEKPPNAMILYTQGLKKMHSRYGAQDRQSWVTLKAAGTLVFNTSSITEPAVVLLAGEPTTTDCFAQELAAVALSAYGLDKTSPTSTIINGASFRQSDGSAAKKVLESRLNSFLSKMNVATLVALDNLPGASPLMLHTYCDHENAPFKDAFIILTMSLDTDSAVGWNGCDAAVHAALTHQWKAENGLNDDKIGALLARIGSLVCLRPQPSITC